MLRSLLVASALVFSLPTQAQILTAGKFTAITTTEDETVRADTLILKWEGPVDRPMASEFEAAFEKFKSQKARIVVDIASEGGSTREGAEAIKVLREIKKSHELVTLVQRGQQCASMCVPIYLQGTTRIAARASTWMFHGARLWWTTVPDKAETEKNLIYFRDAGVDEKWLQSVLVYMLQPGEYWQTGGELIDSQSGIITKALENHRPLPVQSLPIDPMLIGPR